MQDSNAPLLSKMVQSLTDLQQRICTLLREWDDDSGLQQILDVIVMLLDIPLSTPLAKVLNMRQYLYHLGSNLGQNTVQGVNYDPS